MKFKRIATTMLALLLVLSMLLSACSRGGTPSVTPTPEPSPDPGPGNENLNACTHVSTELRNVRAATCVQAGYTGDKVCTACGTIVEAGSEIAILPHAWDSGVVTKQPDCIEQGWLTITCTGCGTTKGESVATVPHDDHYHDALDGTHSHTCSTCTMSAFEAHVPVDAAGTYYPATCLVDGYTEFVCSLCNGVYRVWSESDKAHGHDWSEWEVITAANCANTGVKAHTCQESACGAYEELEIPVATGVHSYVPDENDSYAPTCTAPGLEVTVCEYCAIANEKVLPMIAHELGDPVKRGDWTDSQCLHCDYKVSTFEASGTSATVNTEDIATDRNFEVKYDETTNITFPQEVVSQIAGAGAEVKVDAGVVEDKSTVSTEGLTEEQKQRLDEVEIYNFGLTVGDTAISSFDAGVTVTVPYQLKPIAWDGQGNPTAYEDPDGIQIWYVPTDGTEIEIIGDDDDERVVYNAETGTVTFVVQHFSYYAVAYAETQEMKCRRGVHIMEQVGDPVPATCWSYGYTVIECECCHITELKDVQSMLTHDLSDLIQPNVTCTQGGYVTRECQNEGCYYVVELNYIRATGHTVTGKATCTESSVCSTCHQIVTPAYGHSWTEWTVVVEPTDVKTGLNRRHCPRCGEIEEKKVAATGLVTQINYSTWDELYAGIFKDMLGIEKGSFAWTSIDAEGYTVEYKMTVDVSGNDVLMLMEQSTSASDYSSTYKSLYRNGVVIGTEIDDGELDYAYREDYTGNVMAPVSLVFEYATALLDYYAPQAEASFDTIADFLAKADQAWGEEINAALSDAGFTDTALSLAETFEAMQKVYAYMALKLGYVPGVELGDGVELPTSEDVAKVLEALTTKTQDGTNTVYTWNPEGLMAALDSVLTTLEGKQQQTLAQIIYELIGTELAASYPEITDFATMMAVIARELPGTMLVKDLVNKIVNMIEAEGVVTMAQVYDAIDMLALQIYGMEIDSEAMIAEYAELSLNDMAAGMMGEEGVTLEQLYEYASQTCNETLFGQIVYREMAVSEILAMARQYLDMADVKCDISIVLDANGKLVSIVTDEQIDFVMTSEDGEQRMTLQCMYLEIKCSDVELVIPEEMQAALAINVEITTDAQGNLVVKLPEGYEGDFYISGYQDYRIGQLLKRDDAVSKAVGYDVYVLDPDKFAENKITINNYILVDGKYYEYYRGSESNYTIVDSVLLGALLDNPYILLPDGTEDSDGYYEYNDETFEVWQTVLGPVYSQYGEWRLATGYNAWSKHDTKGTEYNIYESVSFDDAARVLRVSSLHQSGTPLYLGGTALEAMEGALTVTDYDKTVNVRLYNGADGQLYVAECTVESGEELFWLYEEVAKLPTCDRVIELESGTGSVRVSGGKISTESYQIVECVVYVPTYYIHVAGDVYAELYNLYSYEDGKMNLAQGLTSYANLSNCTPVQLPDGNTLWVIDYSYKVDQPYEMMEYGYVQLADDLYIETIAYYVQGEIASVLYHNAAASMTAYFNDLFDINDYMTVNGTTVTIRAELLSALKALCTKPGDYYTLDFEIEADITAGDIQMPMMLSFTLASHIVPEEVDISNIGFGSNQSAAMEPWYELFGKNESYGFEIVPNGDGTLTLIFPGSSVEVGYSVDNGFIADDYLTHNGKNKDGLDVFSMVESYTSDQYLYHGSKYYYTHSVSELALLNLEYAQSLKDQIQNGWHLRQFSYRYEALVDQELYPVYDATIAFYHDNWHEKEGNTFYIMIKDGEMLVLTGVEALGEMELKFEGMVPIDEYFATAAETATAREENNGSYSYWDPATNSIKQINRVFVDFEEYGENGQTYTKSIVLLSETDGSTTRYINRVSVTNYYLDMSNAERVSSLPAYDSREFYDVEYYNGTYTYVSLRNPQTTCYVKLAGTIYRLSAGIWESYEERAISYEEFLNRMAQSDYYNEVVDPVTGEITYFAYRDHYGDGNVNYVNVFEQLFNVICPEGAYRTYIGDTVDGKEVYEIYGYRMESLCSIPQADGTVFYYIEGESDGYLKGQDGRYVRAALYTPEDGEAYVVCYELQRATVGGEKAQELGMFDEVVRINEQAGVITIDIALLEMIPEEFSYSFRMSFNSDGYFMEMDYYQLLGYLMQENNGK